MKDSFKARTTLACGNSNFEIFSLAALKGRNVARLPYSLKILLENLLRFEDGVNVTREDIDALLSWDPQAAPSYEISFSPSRVIMLAVMAREGEAFGQRLRTAEAAEAFRAFAERRAPDFTKIPG